jgi:hypothetical protein
MGEKYGNYLEPTLGAYLLRKVGLGGGGGSAPAPVVWPGPAHLGTTFALWAAS